MDVLSDVLQLVRLRGAVYFHGEFTAPWAIRAGNPGDAGFFVVTRGSCFSGVETLESQLRLSSGDLVFSLQGRGGILRDDPNSQMMPIEKLIQPYPPSEHVRLRYGGGGALTSIVAGLFHFENPATNPLLSALPPLIHIRSEVGEAVPWLSATLKLIASETASDQPGAQIAVTRLTDVLFIQMVRAYVSGLSGPRGGNRHEGWLRALRDHKIGSALGFIHERPEHPWTVAELASRVAMSRSAFFTRFTTLAGVPPLKYVTRWRMHKAGELLRDGRASIAEIASLVGYRSEVAFNKAFKREIGHTPGAHRKQAQGRSSLPRRESTES